jgi:CheY-like chemotaxis protein
MEAFMSEIAPKQIFTPEAETPKVHGTVPTPADTQRPVAVIEDDRDDRALLRKDLNFLFGERPVISFADGALLLQYLEDNPSYQARPWLILLDIHLAGASGLRWLESFHSRPDLADIPVIAVSGDANPGEVREAFIHGVRAFLPKPVSPQDIAGVLRGM